jgi:hypothetical protein
MRYLMTAIFCVLGFCANSQTEKGNKLIGGSGTIDFPTNTSPKWFSFDITPKVGQFFLKNLAIGITPEWGYSYEKRYSGTKENITVLGIGPFIRFYLGKSKLRYFAEAGISYNHIWRSSKYNYGFYPSYKTEAYSFSENIGIGMVYFINQNVGLETKLQYQHSYNTSLFSSSVSNYSYNGLTLNLGLQIYLPAKK